MGEVKFLEAIFSMGEDVGVGVVLGAGVSLVDGEGMIFVVEGLF